MNTFAQEVAGKTAAPARPGFQEYPKQLNKPGVPFVIVKDEYEEENARTRGYDDKPLAVSPRIDVATPMTTPAATQSAYNALKQQFEETVTAFNTRWKELDSEHDRLQKEYAALQQKHSTLVDSNNGLKGRYKTLKDEFDRAMANTGKTAAPAVPDPELDDESGEDDVIAMMKAMKEQQNNQ